MWIDHAANSRRNVAYLRNCDVGGRSVDGEQRESALRGPRSENVGDGQIAGQRLGFFGSCVQMSEQIFGHADSTHSVGNTDGKLIVFESQCLTNIFGPTNENGYWRIRCNRQMRDIFRYYVLRGGTIYAK